MAQRTKLAILAALLAAAIACNPLAPSTPAPVVQRPTATPPPIPTRPSATDTPLPGGPQGGTSGGSSGGGSQTSQTTASIIYGSARGANLGLYFLSEDGQFKLPLALDTSITNAVWPDVSPDGTKVAFVGLTKGLLVNGIFVIELSSGQTVQLTQGDGQHPKWSKDGSRIAYTCGNGNDVCVMNADGSNPLLLTSDSPKMDSHPNWSADGQIVFMSDRDITKKGRYAEIYIMNADGSDVRRLTDDGDAFNANPAVSPGGTTVIYESNRDVASGSELYLVDITGSKPIRVTNDDLWNQNPTWSPDGKLILFSANDGLGNIDLYQIGIDGSNRFRLTHDPAEDGGYRLGFSWFPQPVQIANVTREDASDWKPRLPEGTSAVSNGVLFAANNFNCPECLETGIYFVTFDGANLTKVPNVEGLYPSWEPEFKRFAYVQDGEVYIANADGTGSTQLTHAHASISSLDYNKDGSVILATCQPYGEFDICLIDAQTGAVKNITGNMSSSAGIPYPSWFGDDRILVGRVIIDTLGVQIASAPASGRISPDGTRFAGILTRQVYNMAPDGTDQKKLTKDSPAKGFPIWSPDGSLVFFSVAPGDGRIYLYGIRADGSNPAFQLVTRPIAAGPGPNSAVDVYLGYSFTP